jgi:enoyl-CoA hydratase/carnithine racemase
MSTRVSTSIDGGVATVEFHRPPANFFDREALTEIARTLHDLDTNPAVRVTLLCSEGRHFCPGADLRDIDEQELRAVYREAFAIFTVRKPMIAAVQGAVIGGGLGLALAADFRVGTRETRMSANFAKLGFHQGFGLSVTLPAAVGGQRAAELLYTGRDVMGEEAHKIGLLDRVTPLEDLRAAAVEFAREIAASAPMSLIAIRSTLRRKRVAEVSAALDEEAAAQAALLRTEDFAEGIGAAIAKRVPDFLGR